jgi:enterochelin esterase family protein
VSDDRLLAIDRLRSEVAALDEPLQRDAAVASFFENHALPVVEGNLCTFAVRAAGDSVYLRHRVNQWPAELKLEQIPRTDVWSLTIELEWGARVEYQFEIVRDGSGGDSTTLTTHALPRSPVGDASVCHGPGYEVPDWAVFRAGTDPGRLEELQVPQ